MKKSLLVTAFLTLAELLSAADFAVRVKNGVPQFTKDGQPFSSWIFGGQFNHFVEKQMHYTSRSIPGLKHAHDIGQVRIISFSLYAENYWARPGVREDERYKNTDHIIRQLLQYAPDAYILPRVQIQPTAEWLKSHPDDLLVNSDGTSPKVWRGRTDADVMSKTYRADATREVLELIRHLEATFPGKMAGYQIAALATGEWMYWGGHRGEFFSYSKASKAAFQEYVRKKYATEAALQKAWQKPGLTFDQVEIPRPELFCGDPVRPIREPARDRYVLDYTEFINAGVADFLLEITHTMRQEVGRSRLIGVFYGENLECAGIPNGMVWNGQSNLKRVLASPDVDYLAAPLSYKDRDPFGHATTMSLAESVTMHGKLWLNEDDTSTELVSKGKGAWPGIESAAKNFTETNALMRRNLSFNLQHNFATWWLDLMGNGWWNNPKHWEIMRSFRALEAANLADPQPYNPPVAFVFDPMGAAYSFARYPSPVKPFYHETKALLGKGAQGPAQVTFGKSVHFQHARFHAVERDYGQYLLDDVLTGKTHAKQYIFFGIYALNKGQRQELAKLRRSAACFWGFGSGWIDLETGRGTLAAVKETTGFAVRHAGPKATQQAFATPLAQQKYHLPKTFGDAIRVEPQLSPVPQQGDEVLATYADGTPAIVLRPGKHTQIFCGVSEIPRELYLEIGKRTRVPTVTTPYMHAYRNKHFCTVYPVKDGRYVIRHGFPKGARNMVTGEVVSDGPEAVMQLKKFDVVTLIPENR